MLKMKFWITFFLSLLLIACGGGGDPLTSSEDDTTDENDDGAPVETSVGNPQIGTGTGADYQDDSLDIIITSLSAGGSTQITADIVDASDDENSRVITAEYYVIFSSTCASTGQAEFSKDDDFVSTGSVSVTYTATGCSGTDQITFTLYDSTDGEADTSQVLDTAVDTLEVAPPQIGAINFTGSDTPAISIKTIGNPVLPKLAVLTFTVVDKNNNPVPNRTVNFELTNTKGGVELSLDDGVTDENGQVQAVVLSGTAHTVTSVVASTFSTDGVSIISTSSQPISITTGIPDQDSFEISADILNPGAYDLNGVTVVLSAYVGDQFQNPVADGTIVNFTAESGLIDSFCETVAGICSVNWVSSGYRPGQENEDDYADLERVNECNVKANEAESSTYDCDGASGHTAFGLTTILAYTEGEAGYTDSDNNGIYDTGESFESFPEAMRDDDLWNSELTGDTVDMDENENGPLEFFADYDDDDQRDPAPSFYQGSLCSDEAKNEDHCSSLMHVRDQIILAQALSDSLQMRFYIRSGNTFTDFDQNLDFNDDNIANDSGTFWVLLTDANDSITANGTSFSISGDGYEVGGTSGDVENGIGYLDPDYEGLPSSFGSLFEVQFAVDEDPESVTVTATLGGSSLSQDFVCQGC